MQSIFEKIIWFKTMLCNILWNFLITFSRFFLNNLLKLKIFKSPIFFKGKRILYNFDFHVEFNYETMDPKILTSFLIIYENHSLEFIGSENDLSKIEEILKKKFILGKFHETYQFVKIIGKGNFASVIKNRFKFSPIIRYI